MLARTLVACMVIATIAAFTNAQCRSGALMEGTAISVPNVRSLPRYTMEAWVRHDTTNNQVLFWFDVGVLRVLNGAWVFTAFQSRTGGTGLMDRRTCTGGIPASGTDYHIAATANLKQLRLYINGVAMTGCKQDTTSYSGTYYADAIGGHSSSSTNPNNKALVANDRWTGYIGEPRVWNVAKSATQIRSARFQRVTSNTANLVAAWDFEKTTFRPGQTVYEVTTKLTGTWDPNGESEISSSCLALDVATIVKQVDLQDHDAMMWDDKHSTPNCSDTTAIEAPCADLLREYELEDIKGVNVILTVENQSCANAKTVNLGNRDKDPVGCGFAVAADNSCSDSFTFQKIKYECRCIPKNAKCTGPKTDDLFDTYQVENEEDVHFVSTSNPKASPVAAIRFYCDAPAEVNFMMTITDLKENTRGSFNAFIDSDADTARVLDSVDNSMFPLDEQGTFVSAGAHTLVINERAAGSVVSDVEMQSDLYDRSYHTRVTVTETVASQAILDLDPTKQVGTTIYDQAQGMRWRNLATSTRDGRIGWNLDRNYMQRLDEGQQITLGEFYTHIYWLKWRGTNSGWRTGFRDTSDHCMIVRSGTRDLGFYSNRRNGFRDSRYNIIPNQWNMVVAIGNGNSATSPYGRTRFYIGTNTSTPVYRGISDRVCGGTRVYRLGWPGQGPGFMHRAMIFDRQLTQDEIKTLWKETHPWRTEETDGVDETHEEVSIPRPDSLSHPCKFGIPTPLGYLKNQTKEAKAALAAVQSEMTQFKASVSEELQTQQNATATALATSIGDLKASLRSALTQAAQTSVSPAPVVDQSRACNGIEDPEDCDAETTDCSTPLNKRKCVAICGQCQAASWKNSLKMVDGQMKLNLPAGDHLHVYNGKDDHVATASEVEGMVQGHVMKAFKNAMDEL